MKNILSELQFARGLRKTQTKAESLIWQKLRAKRFEGIKFKRQQPIGEYIVDFISFEKMLVIEIDGGQHNEDKWILHDTERKLYLEGLGYTVLRFWNNEVIDNIEGVFEKLKTSIPSL